MIQTQIRAARITDAAGAMLDGNDDGLDIAPAYLDPDTWPWSSDLVD